jgi:dTDP-4-dehydrorhamnose 3,5-epimerase
MKISSTNISCVKIIEPQLFGDKRGFFKETFSDSRYRDLVGINLSFVQDNHSRSQKGVLRGLHFQKTRPQGKLVSVIRGSVYDVAVDINPESKTFGHYVGVELSEDNHRQLWVPPGMAHGFCVLSDYADIIYKCTDYYAPDDEKGLAWDCPTVQIKWPIENPILSQKDLQYSGLKDLFE